MWCDLPGLSSQTWNNTATNQNLKLEKACEPGCAFCLQCTLPTQPVPRAVCYIIRLLLSFQSRVTSSCSWSIWTLFTLDSQTDQTLDQQRDSASSSAKTCAPSLAFSRDKGRNAAELKEERVECVGCLSTLQNQLFHCQEEVSNPGTAQGMSSVAYRRPGILPWCPLRHRPHTPRCLT